MNRLHTHLHSKDPLSSLSEADAAMLTEAATALTQQLPARRVAKHHLAMIKQLIATQAAESRALHARWVAAAALAVAACLAALLVAPGSTSLQPTVGQNSPIRQPQISGPITETLPTQEQQISPSTATQTATSGTPGKQQQAAATTQTNHAATDLPEQHKDPATIRQKLATALMPTLGKLIVVELKTPLSISPPETAVATAEKALALLATIPADPAGDPTLAATSILPGEGIASVEDPTVSRTSKPAADPPPEPIPAAAQIFLTYDPNTDQGALIVDGLPTLEQDQSYHFWARDAVTGQFLRLGVLPSMETVPTPIPYSVRKVLATPNGFLITREHSTAPTQPSLEIIGQWLAPQP
jgi:hypothetical protein